MPPTYENRQKEFEQLPQKGDEIFFLWQKIINAK